MENEWVYQNHGNAYIRCFYFTTKLCLAISNNPDSTNLLEYMFMTFSYITGIFVIALLLGQMEDVITSATRNQEEFSDTMDKAIMLCKELGVPKSTEKRVRDWFLYTWQTQRTLRECAWKDVSQSECCLQAKIDSSNDCH
jgi:hypothetical protein